jgi:UDP-glucose:glycoprotein glucosyltransferase
MSNYFYDLPTTNLRRNSYIYPSSTGGNLRILNLPELFGKTHFRISPATYLYPSMFASFTCLNNLNERHLAPEFDSISESLYVVADLDSEAGLELIKEAINSLVSLTAP